MTLSIHEKKYTPIMLENCTHWAQCANDRDACPVNFGDTRITFCYVGPVVEMIPRRELQARLLKEAPDFITAIMNVEVPRPDDRLGLKVLDTEDKIAASENMESDVARFLRTEVNEAPGYVIPVTTLFLRYKSAYPDSKESQRAFSSKIPTTKYLKGRVSNVKLVNIRDTWCYGNVSFDFDNEARKMLIRQGDYLI